MLREKKCTFFPTWQSGLTIVKKKGLLEAAQQDDESRAEQAVGRFVGTTKVLVRKETPSPNLQHTAKADAYGKSN